MADTDSGTVNVPIKTQWIFMFIIFVMGNLTGGFGTSAASNSNESTNLEKQVSDRVEEIVNKIETINNSNRIYVSQAESRINARLDSVIVLLDEKIDFNQESIVNLDGYFKGYVEATNNNNGR